MRTDPPSRAPSRQSPRRRSLARARILEPLEPRMLLTTYTVATVATFTGGGKLGTGAQPGGLVMAADGDLYGVAGGGGKDGYGLVFKVAAGTSTIIPLASFDRTDGIYPRGSLVVDAQGDVFGTTAGGGADGRGTLFEYSASANAIETLVSFTGPDGSFPLAGVVADSEGNLYGTTDGQRSGGRARSTVFEWVASTSTLTTLAFFNAAADPRGSVLVDSEGDVFGTTRHNGTKGAGTLFEVVQGSGTITTLASFAADVGTLPTGGLLSDGQGNIIGLATAGGTHNNGTVFEWFASSSTMEALVSFNAAVGSRPQGNLIMDASGNLFGVTPLGSTHGVGGVYELTPDGTASTLTLLTAFRPKLGQYPSGPLVMDSSGDLFGVNFSGGVGTNNGINNRGTLFELLPEGSPQTPVRIVITQGPNSTIAGHTLTTITAQIEDVFGNIVTGDDDDITLQIHSGPTTSSLTGTVTVAAVNGIVTFSGISITTAGTFTLSLTDGVRTSDPSKTFIISPDASTPSLVFTQEPTGTAHNTAILPTIAVSIEDQFGNIITSNTSVVTLSVASGNLNAVLSGTRTAGAFHGTATFPGLSINLAGSYTLKATDGNLAPVTSDPFTIT